MRLSRREAAHYREIIDRYVDEMGLGSDPYELSEVVAWARANGELETIEEEIERYLAWALSEAQRSDKVKYKGKPVRRRACVTVESNGEAGKPTQRTLWTSDVCEAKDEFQRRTVEQRIDGLQEDVDAVSLWIEYINEARLQKHRRPIQHLLHFEPRRNGPEEEAG